MDWSGLTNFANILVTAGSGLSAIFLAKSGISYIMAGGDIRAKASAYDSAINVVKGECMLLSIWGLTTVINGNLKLG